MRRLAPALFLAIYAAAPALAQDINLMTLTCAQATTEGTPLPPARMVPAMAGLAAKQAGLARLPGEAGLAAFAAELRAGCTTDDTRTLSAIAFRIPAVAPGPGDLDMASLTCAELAPLWRRDARVIVPFIAGLLSEAGMIPPGFMDRIGNGVQAACRQPGQAQDRVIDVAAGFR